MRTLSCDVAVIGAGSAGMTAFRAASAHGKRVLLIESGPYGTTCARVGCMPSKLLIAAADAAHAVAEAPAFGVYAGMPNVDGRAVMDRVRAERDRFVDFVVGNIDSIDPSQRLNGHARFIAPDRLQINGHTEVLATSIVIATGSRPAIPEALRELGDRLVVNDDVFDWHDLPDSVAVIGTGIIGLELGQALARLGVRIAIFGRSASLAQLHDPEVLQAARACLGAELDLRLNTSVVSAERSNDAVTLKTRDADGRERTESYQFVLAATGRTPNVAGLGLEHTGLRLNQRGVPVYDPHTMQCGDSAIFLAGDVDEDRPLLHEATDEGHIAGDNAARFPAVVQGARRAALSIAFTDPQIATVGQSSRTLADARYEHGEVSFADQGRSRVMLQNRGLLRVYGEHGTHRFLGAEMIGPRAEHIAHLLAWACQNRMTVEQMLAMPFYHPVVEEGMRTALRNLKEKLVRRVDAMEHCADCTPGR
ncbi:MAG TPA: dihydrolipoyl dehydrogenase [Oxalicibacterium sp.]|nr:dihydrolipoyl dehydrogenase [Oxalicibacterium sp.]